jgi:hypothetical protein
VSTRRRAFAEEIWEYGMKTVVLIEPRNEEIFDPDIFSYEYIGLRPSHMESKLRSSLDYVSNILGDVSDEYSNDEISVLSPSLNRSQLEDARNDLLLSNVTWITIGEIPFTLDAKNYGPISGCSPYNPNTLRRPDGGTWMKGSSQEQVEE